MFEANSAATVHLLDASQRAGVARFLMAGSMEEPDLVAEAPASPYAASKAAAHLFASLYGVLSDLEVVHLQMFMVYGPGQRDETKLVPYVIRSLLAGQSPQLRSAGRPIDWIHVADVVEGIVRCIEAEAAPAAAVPLGTGRLHTVQELVELVVDAMGRPAEPVYSDWPDRPREMVRAADVERAARLLDGWSPRLALREGLEDTIAWYRAHPRAPA
jgi:nucleoside-diphosphate-sugar epimerase